MAAKPKLEVRMEIEVGPHKLRAVVSKVSALPDGWSDGEAVYKWQSHYERSDIKWTGDQWEFVGSAVRVSGPDFQSFIDKLEGTVRKGSPRGDPGGPRSLRRPRSR